MAPSSILIVPDWEQFSTLNDPALVAMREAAQAFARALTTPLTTPRWLSLLGPSGAGKTMLAKLIAAEAKTFCDHYPYLEDGCRLRRVRFASWPKVAERLREGQRDALADLERAWLLVVDDVGAEYDARSTFIPSKLYDLCNARLGRWTVLTSNLGFEQIASRLDARIASRMRRDNSVIIEVDAPDYNER